MTLAGITTVHGISIVYGDFPFSVVLTSDYPFVYKDESGYTIIVGEVENTNNYSVKDVHVTANFYDDVSSDPLEIVKGETILNVIPPHGKSPYLIRSNSPNPNITQVSVSLSEGSHTSPSKSKHLSVELSNIVVDNTLRFSGIIKNDGSSINNANVYLAFYDSSVSPRVIAISTIPIGSVESNEIKKFTFNEKIQTITGGFLLFSESDLSYSDPVNFNLEPFLNVNFAKSYGYHVNYELFGRQFFDTPLVCTYKPDWGEGLNEYQKIARIGITQSAGFAVQDWQSALQENEKNESKDNWRIDYKILTPMDRLNNLQKDCNVIIEFKDKSEQGDNILGITYVNYNNTGVSLIDIFYDNFGHVWTSEELRPTVTHELGHAIGLDHYVADDPMINKEWEEGTREPDSIMTIYSYDNLGLMKIKPIDVEKVKSMYASNGFKSVSASQIISNPKPVLEPQSSGQQVIPYWIKQNAKWWSDGTITDKDFVMGIQFLVQQKIIKVDKVIKSPSNISQDMPSWIKNNAKWWSEGVITEDDFLKGIQFLTSNGIIKVN